MDDGVLTIRLPRVRSTTSRLSVMFSSAGKALAPRSLLSRTSLPPHFGVYRRGLVTNHRRRLESGALAS
jgi:hypothetical protein